MQKVYRAGLLLLGVFLTAFCGSELGVWVGLHGFDQWPIIGFALGVLLLSQVSVWTLHARVQALEGKQSG
jgi:hypothetical protein